MTATYNQMKELMTLAPVIPVITLEHLAHAVPLARALCAGGLRVLEVTLRTACALEAIKAIAEQVPQAYVGAGTVIRPEQIDQVAQAGGSFCVSPGSTPSLLDRARDAQIRILPGAVTASEVMNLLERDIQYIKFFPAEAAGGVASLKSLAGPLPEAHFCPTGGINLDNAPSYLALPSVLCVGGTWVCPKGLLEQEDWAKIETLAREASQLHAGLGSGRVGFKN